MSFKQHLIIVGFIILTVYVAWQWMQSGTTAPSIIAAPKEESPYSIAIFHASWGLNCRSGSVETAPPDVFANGQNTNEKMREDNVLSKVSELCNGKLQCSIPVTRADLGEPAADCADKALEVEYRCFSYDRPWNARATNGTLTINCNKPSK